MSSRNGDKSRFGRQRKQKIARRLVLRTLQAGPAAEPVAETSAHLAAESAEKPHGVIAGAARLVGSALGTLAVETHLAGSPSHAKD